MSMFTKGMMIAEAQKVEALLRMKKLDLHENAIREFKEEGKLNLSEGAKVFGVPVGVLYWLNDEEQKMVDEFEKEYGGKVYHVVKTSTTFGLLYSMLYVSKHPEEWEDDDKSLEEGYAFAYVKNATDDFLSELGEIMIKPAFGGVVRTA